MESIIRMFLSSECSTRASSILSAPNDLVIVLAGSGITNRSDMINYLGLRRQESRLSDRADQNCDERQFRNSITSAAEIRDALKEF